MRMMEQMRGNGRLVRVLTPVLRPGQIVAVCGSHPALGEWNAMAAPAMERSGIPLWTITLPDDVADSTEFKFIIRANDEVRWEDGVNRTIANPGPLEFRGLERWHATGVAVPVFSLRSTDDFGCGDFADLRLLVDWAVAHGQQIIQILPVNDTTMTRTKADSYPYSAISSFALHPLYLRPALLGTPRSEKAAERFERLRRELNAADSVDYPAVIAAKEEYAHIIYNERGEETMATAEFAGFVADNAAWLLPYCVFSVLRDSGHPIPPYSPGLVAHVFLTQRAEALYHAWLQYHLHCQLLDACRYARTRGVAVKGDIPIGVSPVGVDAWQHPELFNLDSAAGAPPDDFAVDGQNWGFPTYNWERMALDGFAWWRSRLEHMAQYFDAYRIDHVLGFFRIWEIPAGVRSGLLGHFSPALPLTQGEMLSEFGFRFDESMATAPADDPTEVLFVPDPRQPGRWHPRIGGYKTAAFASLPEEQRQAYRNLHEDFFYHRHNDFWRESAMRKLPALANATPMLACAEDLGMIPACVPSVLAELRVLALEVQRMPKQFGRELGNPAEYAWLNVATTSTHDMPPLRLWLMQQRGEEAPVEEIRSIIAAHVQSPAMLVILPIQDWLAAEPELRRDDPSAEQINVPADPAHYWRYRLHLPL